MKRLLLASAFVAAAATAMAQGTVKFSNYSTVDGINSPVYAPGNVKLGSAYLGQLYAGPTADSLAPVGTATAFKDAAGVGSGYVIAGTVTIGSVTAGNNAFIQLRAWEAAGGTSYEAAQAAGKQFGSSATLTIATGGGGSPPAVPAPLTGLASFTLVPEPSTLALGMLGAAALLLRRRS
jgi:hypothetical protein